MADYYLRIFLNDVEQMVAAARSKFPGDTLRTIAFAEEAGELVKAMLDEDAAAIWKEAVQAAAMAARLAIEGDNSVDAWRATKGLGDSRSGRRDDSK